MTMGMKDSGYSRTMRAVKQHLRKLDFPDSLFDADFEQKEAINQERVAVLRERMKAKEQGGEYDGLQLPWTELRQRYEQDVKEGKDEPFIATQSLVPNWKRSFDIAQCIWKQQMKYREEAAGRKKQKEMEKKEP